MNKLISLDHAYDRMINGLSIFISLHHLLVQLRVRYFSANSDPALYGLLNLTDHGHQLYRCLDRLRSHPALSGIQGGHSEYSVGLLHMLHFHLGLQVNAGDRLGEADDGLELADSDRDARALLRDLLVLIVHSILDVHVLEDVACLL